MQEAIIYSDGSCGRSGDGGYAVIVATPTFGVEVFGCTTKTTSNRMELTGAIEGLKILREPHQVKLVSDSAYMINSLNHHWYEEWFREEARPVKRIREGKPHIFIRPNLDLWHQLVDLVKLHDVTPVKIKGHSGHEHNERVDKLAVRARKEKIEGVEILYGYAAA